MPSIITLVLIIVSAHLSWVLNPTQELPYLKRTSFRPALLINETLNDRRINESAIFGHNSRGIT